MAADISMQVRVSQNYSASLCRRQFSAAKHRILRYSFDLHQQPHHSVNYNQHTQPTLSSVIAITRPEVAEAKSIRPRQRPTLTRPRPKLHYFFSQILHFDPIFSKKNPEIFGSVDFRWDFKNFGSKRALTLELY